MDGPSLIDPLVAEGPLTPVDVFRPLSDPQRVLFLDGPTAMMADLATSDIRRFENGPPVTLPMVSNRFDLAMVDHLLVQAPLDPRQSSSAAVLFSLQIGPAVIRVETIPEGVLRLIGADGAVVSGPVGSSPAIVLQIDSCAEGATISARNADTLSRLEIVHSLAGISSVESVLTVGGPSANSSPARGRRRSGPLVVDLRQKAPPVDNVRRAVGSARRAAGRVKRRVT